MTAHTNTDPHNATLYLLDAGAEANSAIAVALSPAQIPGFAETRVTERKGVDLAQALTDLRAGALEHLDLILDQFEGTEKLLPMLHRFLQRNAWLLRKEEAVLIARVLLEQIDVQAATPGATPAEGEGQP